MDKVLESKKYEMFEMISFNRDVEKTKALEESMRIHGFIPAYPLHVIKNGGEKYLIKAGHHRFYVAQKIGIPVKYVVCDDNATIHELERATNKWNLQDYLESYCKMGKEEYLKVRYYCEETGIGLGNAIYMLAGQTASKGSSAVNNAFKDGKFKVKESDDHAYIVRDIVLYLKKYSVPFGGIDLFVRALSRIVKVDDFDLTRLKLKIKNFHGLIEKKVNLDQYLDMLEDLYNRQSQSKIPLKFLANEEAKRRNPIKTIRK
jgi:hypothetical protein